MKMGINNHRILFSPGALLDMREARTWYNLQQKGLDKRFTEDVRKTVSQLIKSLFRFCQVWKHENRCM
jgi:hypothetical protein